MADVLPLRRTRDTDGARDAVQDRTAGHDGDACVAVRPAPWRGPERKPEGGPEPLWREAVGRQLRAERTARGERIADVAGRAGVSPQYLSEVERGRKDASSEILSALAGALDLTVRELTRRSSVRLAAAGASGQALLAA